MDQKKLILHMKVIAAVEMSPCDSIIGRIKYAANRVYEDENGKEYRFTWRTISTWYYRFKKDGITGMKSKRRSDYGSRRKVSVEKVAEAIHEVLPLIRTNKKNKLLKTSVYRMVIEKGFFNHGNLSESVFSRIVRENNLLDNNDNKKHRLAFAMQHANEMWQADTMVGPYVYDHFQKKKRQTYLIAFIDDCSRLIIHGEFFFHDNTDSLQTAFQTALTKRGKPEIVYCDNGANYSAKGIQLACLRLGIKLSHSPIRDGSAKGKIERFFRTFRDQFLTIEHDIKNIDQLNRLTTQWIEDEYNSRYHSSVQMAPIDRFSIDRNRIEYLPNEDFIDEVFFIEEDRIVLNDNTFRFDNARYEAPVHLRGQTIKIRFHPKARDRVLVFFKDQRMGEANFVNFNFNARTIRKRIKDAEDKKKNYKDMNDQN